jgi:thiamine-phosphate pyrophosphorylase
MQMVFPPLYAIIDAGLLKTSELRFAQTLAESGVELLQYRRKHATSRELFDVSRALALRLSQLGKSSRRAVRFIVNDRPDIALLVNAGGVHVGQTDLSVADARAILQLGGLPPDGTLLDRTLERGCWVGVSTHTLAQLEDADRTSADYIAFGPIFPTVTKEQPDPVVGLALLAEARTRTKKPLVAIGGITLERAAEVYRAGADSVAVASDLIVAPDPAARARAFLAVAATAATPGRLQKPGSTGQQGLSRTESS